MSKGVKTTLTCIFSVLIAYVSVLAFVLLWSIAEILFPVLRETRQNHMVDKVVYGISGSWNSYVTVNGVRTDPSGSHVNTDVLDDADAILIFVHSSGDLQNLDTIDSFVSDPEKVEELVLSSGRTFQFASVRFGLRIRALVPLFVRQRRVIVRPLSDIAAADPTCMPEAFVALINAKPRHAIAQLNGPCKAA